MAQGVRIEFESSFPSDWSSSDGKLLNREFEALESVARRCDVTPLSAYMDNRPIPEEVVADDDALEDFAEGWDEWFASGEGAAAVEQLLAGWATDSKARRNRDHAGVALQLRQLAECLRRAEKHRVRFRLVIE